MAIQDLDASERGIHVVPNSTCLGTYGETQQINVRVERDSIKRANAESFSIDHVGVDEAAVLSVPIIDIDRAAVTVSAASGTVNQGVLGGAGAQSAQYDLALTSTPTQDVNVSIIADDPSLVTITPSSIVFSAGVTPSAQTVTVSAVAASAVDDVVSASLRLVHSVESTDSVYDAINVDEFVVDWYGAEHPRVIISASSVEIIEGDSQGAELTVKLGVEPSTGPVTLTLQSSELDGLSLDFSPAQLTFTQANYSSAQTVQVSFARDYEYRGQEINVFQLSFAVGEGSSQPYEDNALVEYWPSSSIPVNVREVDLAAVTLSSITGAIRQGVIGGAGAADVQYNVTLSSIPVSDVDISITADRPALVAISPSDLTFLANAQPTPQLITVSAVDAAVLSNVSYDILHISHQVTSADADFDQATVPNFVADWYGAARPKIVISMASLDVDEGSVSAESFTIKLGAQPSDGPVYISLSSSALSDGAELTISPSSLAFATDDWSVAQTVEVSYPTDGIFRGTGATTFSIAVEIAANSSEPYADPSYIVFNPASTVGVEVREADEADVSLSAIVGEIYQGAIGGAGAVDAQYAVTLTSTPTEDVAITITADDASLVTISPSTLTFSAGVSPSSQTVTVSAADATVITNVTSAILTLSHAVASADSFYSALSVHDFVADWFGSARPRVLLSASALEVDEGSADGDTFTVKLAVAPSNGPVSVDLTSSALADGAELTISPAALTFTTGNWSVAQTVQVTYPDDDTFRGDADTSFSITASVGDSSSAPYADSEYIIFHPSSTVSVGVHEGDQAAIALSAVAGTIRQGAIGGAGAVDAQYAVTLTSTPTEDVTITITADDASLVTISPSTLTFSAGVTPSSQTVTVSAADATVITNVTSAILTLSHAVASADSFYSALSVHDFVADWFGSARPRVLLSASALEVDEGSADGDTFTVKLAVAPSNGPVSVDLTSSALADGAELTISPAALTFTTGNWSVAQTVQVTYPDDDTFRGDADTSFSITASVGDSSSAPYADSEYIIFHPSSTVIVGVHEGDQAAITLSAVAGTIRQGAIGGAGAVDAQYAVTLTSTPTEDVTITITADDASLVTISPSTLTFSAGVTPSSQTVTVSAADATAVTNVTSATLTLSHSASSVDGFYDAVEVSDFVVEWFGSARPRVLVSASSLGIIEGANSATSLTVYLGAEPSDGTVGIYLASSALGDGAELDVSPTLLEFTSENWNEPQLVQVQYPRDYEYRGSATFDFQLDLGIVGESSEPYRNETYVLFWPTSSVAVTVREADQAAVTISDVTGTIRQGAIGGAGALNATYSVSLTSVPTEDVTISLSADKASLVSIVPSELVFTAGETPSEELVTIAAADATQVSNVSFDVLVVTHTVSTTDASYTGASIPNFEANWYGAAHPRVVLSAASIQVVEGTEVPSIFYVKLGVQPSAGSVGVVFTSSILDDGSQLVITPASVQFNSSDWNAEQAVRVTYPRDFEYRGADVTTFQVGLSIAEGSGEPYADAQYVQFWPVSEIDANVNDADLPEIVLSEQTVYVTENGQSANYELILNSRPGDNVTVSIANPNSDLVSVSPSQVVFTRDNWNVARTIRIEAVDSDNDNAYDLASAITILQHSASSGDEMYDGISARFSPTQLLIVRRYENPSVPNCPGGTHLAGENSIECVACPAGYRCPVETNDAVPCLLGTFSLAGQVNCTVCPAGMSCPQTNANAMTPCASGTYSVAGEASCSVCPAGQMCPSTEEALVQDCPAGTYSLEGQTSCTACPAGSACPDLTGETIHSCEMGTYSEAGMTSCLPCPAGYACTATNRPPTEAEACAPGSYAGPQEGNTLCTLCPAGFACPYTTESVELPCSAGEYSTHGNATCTSCPAGMACTRENGPAETCAEGHYSLLGDSACHACPKGHKCPNNDALPVQCNAGSYGPATQSTGCSPCEAGYFCPNNGTVTMQICPVGTYSNEGASSCEPCTAGFYCSEGSVSPTPPEDECEEGTYCPAGGPQENCPAGTYGTKLRGVSEDDACDPCPAGYYCPEASTSESVLPCVPGYYCPEGSASYVTHPCRAGTYNPNSVSDSDADCSLVPAGFYARAGSSAISSCPSGYYCLEGTTHEHEYPCPAGTYSGPVTELRSEEDCRDCTEGHYCPAASTTPTSCPEGTYNPGLGASIVTNCLSCPAGYTCPTRGLITYITYVCKAGHYCPEGTYNVDARECPAGTYTDADNLTSASECTPCPAGKACYQGTGGDVPKENCAVGHYCPEGTQYPTQHACPAGTYTSSTSLTAVGECSICPAGSYCMGGLQRLGDNSDTVGNCGAGYYCPAGTWRPDQFPCPDGTYSAEVDLEAVEECTPCDVGHYCIDAATEPAPCPAGSYANETGESDPACSTCPAGYECPEGTDEPISCNPGEQSAAGQEACDICEAGYFCKANATTRDVMYAQPCIAGLYCPEGVAIEPSFAQHACRDAHYCPEAISAPIECPVGTYNSLTGQGYLANCTACDAGFYCVAQSNSVTGTCDPGFYCPPASTGPQQFPCPEGTYRSTPQGDSEAACAICPSGSYCPVASITPITCPRGSYCLTASKEPRACPIGRYGNFSGLTSGAACTPCPGGFFCDGLNLTQPTGLCDEGYYCSEGSYTSTPNAVGTNWTHELGDELESALVFGDIGDICPLGHYCPRGSSQPQACASGTFNSAYGATSVDACLDCTPGRYCAGAGNEVPTGACEAGYFCPGGSRDPTDQIAPPGTFAPAGAASTTNCTHGSFNSEWGKDSCTLCHPGFFCPETGLTSPEECPEGMYCPEGSISPSRCPEGTYSNSTQLGAESQCTPCDPGSYCASNGLVAPSGLCAAGYYCLLSSTMRIPSNDAGFGGVCPAGYYCVEGTASPEPCPLGTYGTKEQAKSLDDCKSCEPGSYCGERGLTAPSGPCAAGYFCNGTSSVSSQTPELICPAGFSCPAGTSHPVRCDEGTYAPDKGAASCTECPGGYFCDGIETTTAVVCPAGSYCPPGTGASPPRCPPGTFSSALGLSDVSLCSTCPAGQFCADYGLLNTSGICDPGYVCEPGSETQYGGGVECIDADMLPHECPRGHYCLYGRALPCPIGTYNPFMGEGSRESCRPCEAGRWCFEEATAYQDDFMCPTGHYCESSTALPIPCPAGTYRDETGGAAAGDCAVCPPGEYCPGDAALSPVLEHDGVVTQVYWNASSGSSFAIPCPAGTFCTGGNVEPQLCPIGYVASAPEMSILRDSMALACSPCPGGTHGTDPLRLECGVCDPGYVCVFAATTPTPEDLETEGGYICPKGHYCPAGTITTFPCSPGSFANDTGGFDEDVHCLPCAGNTYNELWGVSGCKPCASSSSSTTGATACNCQGRNRAFEPSTGKCLCAPGFEAFDQTSGFTSKMPVDEDGTEDCQPITYERCGLGEVLNADGICATESAQCATECADLLGTGRMSTVLGVCDCDGSLPLEQTCGAACRANATSGYLAVGTGKALVLDDGTSVDLDEVPGFYGTPSCSSADACSVVGCEFGSEGSSGCDYNLPGVFSTSAGNADRRRRRRLQSGMGANSSTTTLIAQPVVCINTGDTLIFKLVPDEGADASVVPAYPVYKKDSLLNTNADFDYGPFRYLEGAAYVRLFAFTFTDPGMYVFGSSRDLNAELIVSVQPKGSACPTEATIMPRSTATLAALGAKRSETILLEPDWSLLGTLLGGMAGLVILLLGVLFCFREFALGTVRVIPTYRGRNRLGDAKKLLKGKRAANGKSRSVAPMAKVFTPEDAAKEGLQPLGHARWAEEDVDPRELVERMVSNHEEVHDHLTRHDAKVETLFGNLQAESQQLKEMLQAIKEDGVRTIGGQPLLENIGDRIKALAGSNDENNADADSETLAWSTGRDSLDSNRSGSLTNLHRKEQQLLERSWQESAERELDELNTKLEEEAEEAMLEEQLKHEEQLEDLERMLLEREDISDEERERILRDFERDQEMLRDTLDLEKRRQQEDLKNRLAERNLRSYRATKRRQRSEREEEALMESDEAAVAKPGEDAAAAARKEEVEARKKAQVAKLLAIQEEAELEELDMELQRERVQAEAEMLDASKEGALSALGEEDRAKLEKEMVLMRASADQNAEDEARAKKEELREKLLRQKRDEAAALVTRTRHSISIANKPAGEADAEYGAQGSSGDGAQGSGRAATDDEDKARGVEVLNKVLAELAEEEVEAKVEIEAALEEETREEAKKLQGEMAAALAGAKKDHSGDSDEAKDLVTSIRENYKRRMDQLQDETAAKRKQQYEALKSRLKNRRHTRVKEVVQEEKIAADVVEQALDDQDSDADVRLEMELQERHKEDVARRLELDEREAELRRREAEVALRMSAEREGKDAEAEVKRLRESHEAALVKLGDSQARSRDKQREALKRRAQERKQKREQDDAAAKAKAESEAAPGGAAETADAAQAAGSGKRENRATALWENAVDRISIKLNKRLAEARALEEEKARLGKEHEKVIEEMRKRQEEERKRLEEEMEAARQKLLLERKREEAAAKELAEDERRRREEEAALSAKTAQELEAIKEQHERDFNAKQEQEKMKRERQREKVMKKLEEKKARKRQLLERRHQQTMKKTEAMAIEKVSTPQISREEEMRQEKAAIAQLMKHAAPEGVETNELYRAIEKILEPRHTREKLELSQRQFQQRTQQIKSKFAEVQNEKHERKKELIQSGASLDEIEKLEAECKQKLREIEDRITAEVEDKQKAEEDEMTRRQAQEIGKYVAKYARKPKETIQQDVQAESSELRAMLDKEREFRLQEIQNERAAAEFRAREAFDKAILDLERGLRDFRAEHAGETDAVFEARKAKLLQKQMTSHDVVLKTARDDSQRAQMRSGFERERERLATAIRAEHLRQVKSVEARVERLKARSARYYRRVLEARLRDIADVTTRKVVIMDDALRRMFAQRNAKMETVMSSTPSEFSPPGSPMGAGGADALYYEQAFPIDAAPRNLAELQAMRRSESMRRISALQGDPANANASPSASSVALEKKLEAIETLLQSMRGVAQQTAEPSGHVSESGSHQQYTDPLDAGFTTSSEVVEIAEADLLPTEKSRLRLGNRILRILGLQSQVQLLAARSVPANQAQQSAFRHSFCWKDASRELFLRVERFTNVGDFILVLVHCLAHIKVHKSATFFVDMDPTFIQEFHAQLRTVNNELIGFAGLVDDDEEAGATGADAAQATKVHHQPTKAGTRFPARLSAYSAFSEGAHGGDDGSAVLKLLRDLKLDKVQLEIDEPASAITAIEAPSTEHAMHTKLKTQVAELEKRMGDAQARIRDTEEKMTKLQAQADDTEAEVDNDAIGEELEALGAAKEAEQHRMEKLSELLRERKQQLARFLEQNEEMKTAISAGLLQDRQ